MNKSFSRKERYRRRTTVILVLVSAGLLTAACSSSGSPSSTSGNAGTTSAAAGNPKVTLSVEAYVPDTDPVAKWLMDLASQVSKDTDGAVTLKLYLNSTLVSQTNAPSAIHADSVNMGEVQANALDQFEQGLDILEQPFLFDTNAQANAATESAALRNAQNVALAKQGLMNLASCSAGIQELISTKPIDSVAQMNGLRLRVSSAADVKLFNGALKTNETVISLAETYEAFKLGTVQAAVSNPTSILESNWQQVAPYVDEIPVRSGMTDLLVNVKALDQLSASEQTILERDAAASSANCDQLREASDDQANQTMKNQGEKFISLTPAQLQGFKTATASVLQNYINSTPLAKQLYNDSLAAANTAQ